MKVGYHFTTWDTYQQIRETGLRPMPWEQRHSPTLAPVRKYIEDGCIWVYTQRHPLDRLMGMILYVAINHRHHRIVRLAVSYDDWQAASFHAYREMNDPTVNLNLIHDLSGAGPFNHFREPFELLIVPIAPEHIQLAGEWDLRQFTHDGLPRPLSDYEQAEGRLYREKI